MIDNGIFFRYFHNCTTEMNYKEVEEEHPLCEVEMMNTNHASCKEQSDSGFDSFGETCKRVMKCSIGMKMMKKSEPKTVCEDIAIGEEEKCVDMVKLKKEKHEEKFCSFHPKTVCKPSEGRTCKMVKRKMCDYMDSGIV